MRVYFVRHGESTFNKELRHQFPDTPLSEYGEKQAITLANRFKDIPVDKILSSNYTRARQTAEEIEKITSVPVVETELLIERRMPTSFRGKLVEDPELKPIHENIRLHFGEKEWHFEDEESFFDLMERAGRTLNYIASQKGDHVVVVTHGVFLITMIYVVLLQDNVEVDSYLKFKSRMECSNTGLTLCEYNEDGWKLLTWNDHAHLGEV